MKLCKAIVTSLNAIKEVTGLLQLTEDGWYEIFKVALHTREKEVKLSFIVTTAVKINNNKKKHQESKPVRAPIFFLMVLLTEFAFLPESRRK